MAPDDERAQDRARERQAERAETVESILDDTESLFRDHKYPTTSEELAVEYGDEPIGLPNETESLGSVLDRLDQRERFDSPEEVREAVYSELTGAAAGPEEYNQERDLETLDAEVEDDLADDSGR